MPKEELPSHGHQCFNDPALCRKGCTTWTCCFSGNIIGFRCIFVEEKNQLPLLCHPFQTLPWMRHASGEYLEVSPPACALSTPPTPPHSSFSGNAPGIPAPPQKLPQLGINTEESQSASLQRRVDFSFFLRYKEID